MVAGNSFQQNNVRFRRDDGPANLDEASGGATWLAPVNTNITFPINGGNFRMRCGVSRAAATDTGIISMNMSCSINGGSEFKIDQVGRTIDFKIASVSTIHYAHRSEAVDIGPPDEVFIGTFNDAGFDDGAQVGGFNVPFDGGISKGIVWLGSEDEPPERFGLPFEWCMRLITDPDDGTVVEVGDVITFRQMVDVGTVFQDGYFNVLTLTVGEPFVPRRIFNIS